MASYAIISDYASLNRPTKTKITLSPRNIFSDIELDDARAEVLYKTYVTLLAEQYTEVTEGGKE